MKIDVDSRAWWILTGRVNLLSSISLQTLSPAPFKAGRSGVGVDFQTKQNDLFEQSVILFRTLLCGRSWVSDEVHWILTYLTMHTVHVPSNLRVVENETAHLVLMEHVCQ